MTIRRLAAALIALLACLTATTLAAEGNLLTNGDFEKADAKNLSADWYHVPGGGAQRGEEAQNHFLHLTVTKADESAVAQREIKLDPSWKALKFSAKVRFDDIKPGKKGWNDGRILLMFLDGANKNVGKQGVLNWQGTRKEWREESMTAAIPSGAAKVKVQIALFSVTRGTLDVDDAVLVPTDPPAAETEAAPQGEAPKAQPLPYVALDSTFAGAVPEGKQIAGWTVMAGAPEVVKEKEASFLRLQATDADRTVQVRRYVPLHPDWGKLKLSARIRHSNVKRGDAGWQSARIIAEFLDARSQKIATPEALNWKGTSKGGFIDVETEYVIPFGAARLKLDPALLQVQAGTLDIESLRVTILTSRSELAKGDLLPEAWKPALTPHWREKTQTRDRICLNGVWKIRPIGLAANDPKQVTAGLIQDPPLPAEMPAGLDWGYVKVPSTFPGSKENAHDVALPEAWTGINWAGTDAVWLRREIDPPAEWTGKRIVLSLDTVQSMAAVFVADKHLGMISYPAGEIDLTESLTPGKSATITLLVIAKPFSESRIHAMNPNELYLETAELKQKGLCGDVFLEARPTGATIDSVQFRPSVRKQELGVQVRTNGAAGKSYKVRVAARFGDAIEKDWTSPAQVVAADGTLEFAFPWLAKNLWDIDAPNLYHADVTLLDEAGNVVDEVKQRFGFREIWLDGRDIILNGSPIHWRTTKIGSTFGGRSKPLMAGTFKRMRQLGFNTLILDYDVNPGSAPSYAPLFEAADETGVIVVASIPCLLPWKGEAPDAAARKQWEALTAYSVKVAQNHPSVLAYSTNHNRLGYPGSLNPEKIDGLHEPVSSEAEFNEKRKLAAESEAFIRSLDPTREVYHHSGGNFGSWESANCYLNWMPIQERADYLSHWSSAGKKPLFLTEFGMPFVASWGRFRGPGVARPTTDNEPLFVEYSASLTGARAYALNAVHESYVDNYESAFLKRGRTGWGELSNPIRRSTEWNYVEIQTMHAYRTFPAMRTYGISALLPWDFKSIANWTDQTPARVVVTEPAEAWTTPGLHPDFTEGFAYAYDQSWFTSPAADTYKMSSLGEAYRKVNADVLAWIAGDPKQFTEQRHLYQPGDTVRKQVIVINDLRRELVGQYDVEAKLGGRVIWSTSGQVKVAPGRQQRDVIEFAIPPDLQGAGTIVLSFNGTEDSFAFDVLPPTPKVTVANGVKLWDPKGDTEQALQRIGVTLPRVEGAIDASVTCLVIGREALTVEGAAPDVRPLLERGGRVVVFEQSNDVLTRRLGFRTAVPSLRNVFARVANHPLLEGLNDERLRDWNGDATLISPKLKNLPEFESKYPAGDWLGFRNTRVWKVNNTGQVASVIIEKPQTGDFLPIIDGGFDLQYSPLLLARQGNGEILFCQMDLSARTASDPAADRLLANIVAWTGAPVASRQNKVVYVGDEPTAKFLQSLGATFAPGDLNAVDSGTCVLGPGVSADQIARAMPAFEKSNATYVLLFQSADTLKAFAPILAAAPERLIVDQLPEQVPEALVGVGPSELHLRARTAIQAIRVAQANGWNTDRGAAAGFAVGGAKFVFVQIDPRAFDYSQPSRAYVKLTHNRTRTLLSRVLANVGVPMQSPLLDHWSRPSSRSEVDLTTVGWEATVDPSDKLTPDAAVTATEGWRKVAVPGALEAQHADWSPIAGRFWYRVRFDVPVSLLEDNVELTIGMVDDEDWTFLNGQPIGHVGEDTHPKNYYKQLRAYKIPAKLLKAKDNVLVIKGNNLRSTTGILEGPARIAPVARRWQDSYYHDVPVASDDPYRYYRW